MSKYELLEKKVKECKSIDINNIDISEIDEITTLKIKTNVPSIERIADFISRAKNPYVFKVNDTIVKMTYSSVDVNAMNCLKKIIVENI